VKKELLFFSLKTFLKMLGIGDFWMMDGTFKVIPLQLYQVYTIHSNVMPGSKAFPILMALLSGKNEQIYDKMSELIVEFGAENRIFQV
jgi:hypothetical protein